MPDCNPACQKIIINTGFMAALAPILATRHKSVATFQLSEAAQALTRMHAAVGLVPSSDGFAGCNEAKQLVEWIKDPSKIDIGTVTRWTDDIWSAIADLAAGKFSG